MISTPFELVKCRQQLDSKRFHKTSSVIRNIYKSKGFFGLYKGFCVTFNRDVPTYGIYFYVYYTLKDRWGDSSFKLLMAGGISGRNILT